MTSGIAFDHPNRLSRLRAFPYGHFKIYTIVPIVRIELNSTQAIEVVSVARVVCDRLSTVSSRSSEHFLRRLGRSGRSGRSYGNQALRTTTTTLSTTTGSELRNTAQARPERGEFHISHDASLHTILSSCQTHVSVRSHETPRTESDKHCDQNKANV